MDTTKLGSELFVTVVFVSLSVFTMKMAANSAARAANRIIQVLPKTLVS